VSAICSDVLLMRQAGLSARYLGSIERGRVSASVTVLGRLAQAFRVDPCELIRAVRPLHVRQFLVLVFVGLNCRRRAIDESYLKKNLPVNPSLQTCQNVNVRIHLSWQFGATQRITEIAPRIPRMRWYVNA
jgi:transcriptional regulator with XRE-family HTH domain